MKKVLSLLLVFSITSLSLATPAIKNQDPVPSQTKPSPATELTNKDVLEMIKSGLAADIVVAKIKASPSKFDTTPTVLGDLKAAGVPDAVIMAMVQVGTDTKPAEVALGPEVPVK